jgi:hypothetical protein
VGGGNAVIELDSVIEKLAHAGMDDEARAVSAAKLLIVMSVDGDIVFTHYNPIANTWDMDHAFAAARVGDAFNCGQEDAESILLQDVDALYSAWTRFYFDGIVAWAAKKRGVDPQPSFQTNDYHAARALLG